MIQKFILLLVFISLIYCSNFVHINEKYGKYCGYKNGDNTYKSTAIDILDYHCACHDYYVQQYGMKNLTTHINFGKAVLELTKEECNNNYCVKLQNTISRLKDCLTGEISDDSIYIFTLKALELVLKYRTYELGTEDGKKHYLFPVSVRIQIIDLGNIHDLSKYI